MNKVEWLVIKMRIFSIIITLALMTGLMTAGQVDSFALGGIDETVAVVATAVKTEDIDASSPLIDNFNDNGIANRWNGQTGTFTDNSKSGSCFSSNNSSIPYEGSHCLQLNYDVSAVTSYAGYYSKLESHNITPYTKLSFWIKGSSGGEFFKIELKNNGTTSYWYDAGGATSEQTHYYRNTASLYINDYLDGGVTTSWQNVKIPLQAFANLDSISSMKELVVSFENAQAVINQSPTAGSIYIDKIELLNETVNAIRIDHYGDKLSVNALGGQMGNMPAEPPSVPNSFHSFSLTEYHNWPNSLLSEYEVPTGWSGIFVIFGGGYTDGTVEKPDKGGWIPVQQDMSGFNYLTFYAKARAEAENPKYIKIELKDASNSEGKYITGLTTSWQKFTIPLTDFTTINKASLTQMSIVYEDWVIFFYGDNHYDGAVYIDELQFEN